MKYTVMGYTVSNAAQVRSVMLVAKLQGRQHVVDQCVSLIRIYEGQ
jgi:hypothetical protein